MKRLLTLALILTGCATLPPTPREPLLTLRPIPAGQRCSWNDPPIRVTALHELVDSAALADRLQLGGPLPQGHTVFRIGPDSLGVPDSTRILEGTHPEAIQQRVADDLHATARQQAPGRRGWGMIVRLETGDSLRWRIGAPQECAPALENSGEIARLLQKGLEEVMSADPGARRLLTAADSRSFLVRVRIDTAGVIEEVHPVKLLQHRGIDSMAVAVSRQMQFKPAWSNGSTVPVWVQLPLHFNAPPADPPNPR